MAKTVKNIISRIAALDEGNYLSTAAGQDQDYDRLCKEAAAIAGAEAFTLFLEVEQREEENCIAAQSGEEPLQLFSQLSGLLAIPATTTSAKQQQKLTILAGLSGRRDGIGALLSLPLKFGGENLGKLNLGSRQTDAFARQDREVYQLLAQKISSILFAGQLIQQRTNALEKVDRLLHQRQSENLSKAESPNNGWDDNQVSAIKEELGLILSNAGLLPMILEVRSYKRAKHAASVITDAANRLLEKLGQQQGA